MPDEQISKPQSEAYRWMDATRTLAAFAVVISHARDFLIQDYTGERSWAPFYFLTGLGHQAVIVFFVLSGFWIGRTTLQNLHRARFWRNYIVARLTRLLIVLVPTLALGGVLDFLGGLVWQLPFYTEGSTHSLSPLAVANLGPTVFLGNLAFLQTILVPNWGTNGPLWSLAYEFWFYIWFPSLVSAWRGKPTWFLASIIVAAFAPQMLTYFLIWLMGVAVHLSENRDGRLRRILRNNQKVSMVIGLALFIATLAMSQATSGWFADFILGMSFAALLIVMLNTPKAIGKAPQPLVFYGGNVSYTLYASHLPILVFVIAISGLERRLPSPSAVALVLAATFGMTAIAFCLAKGTEARTGALRVAILSGRQRS